jgi:large subunit ribosomal protein L25
MAKQQAEKLKLAADKREVLGKGVKKLRREGVLPANIFGKDFKSLSIAIKEAEFLKTYKAAGETGVVYVQVEKEEIPTLIKSVQKHPVNDFLLHIDFRKIDLKKKIETEVPLEFIGESPAVKDGAVVIYQQDKVMIEALPTNIPSEIQIDLEKLTEIGQDVKISDLPKSDDYEYIDDPETVLVSLTEHKEESIEPDTTSTIPEALEGETAAEGGDSTTADGDATAAPADDKKED